MRLHYALHVYLRQHRQTPQVQYRGRDLLLGANLQLFSGHALRPPLGGPRLVGKPRCNFVGDLFLRRWPVSSVARWTTLITS